MYVFIQKIVLFLKCCY